MVIMREWVQQSEFHKNCAIHGVMHKLNSGVT